LDPLDLLDPVDQEDLLEKVARWDLLVNLASQGSLGLLAKEGRQVLLEKLEPLEDLVKQDLRALLVPEDPEVSLDLLDRLEP
jgi:hypothetical protein